MYTGLFILFLLIVIFFAARQAIVFESKIGLWVLFLAIFCGMGWMSWVVYSGIQDGIQEANIFLAEKDTPVMPIPTFATINEDGKLQLDISPDKTPVEGSPPRSAY